MLEESKAVRAKGEPCSSSSSSSSAGGKVQQHDSGKLQVQELPEEYR